MSKFRGYDLECLGVTTLPTQAYEEQLEATEQQLLADELAQEELDRAIQQEEEQKETARQRNRAAVARKQVKLKERWGKQRVIFCTICGTEVCHEGEPSPLWGKARKCQACKESGRKAGDVKYCRTCGVEFYRAELDTPQGWSTACCCKKHSRHRH